MRTLLFPVLLAYLATPAIAGALELSGQWEGTYTCAQGETAMKLDIQPQGGQWSGVFSFGPLKSNKAVPAGSYEIFITQEGKDIVFTPGAWISQPQDYVTVGLRGMLSTDPERITGEVEFSSCTGFEIERTSSGSASSKTK